MSEPDTDAGKDAGGFCPCHKFTPCPRHALAFRGRWGVVIHGVLVYGSCIMKTLLALLLCLAAVNTYGGPQRMSQAEITMLVKAVAPNESINVSPNARGGYSLYGPNGRSGNITYLGGGISIYYEGKSLLISYPSYPGGGWTIPAN